MRSATVASRRPPTAARRRGCAPTELCTKPGGRQDLTRARSLADPGPGVDSSHDHVRLPGRKHGHRITVVVTERSGPGAPLSGSPEKPLRGPGRGPGCPAALDLHGPEPAPTPAQRSRPPGSKAGLLRGGPGTPTSWGPASERRWTRAAINKHPGGDALRPRKRPPSARLAF